MNASELSINRNKRSRNDAMNSLWHTFFIHLHKKHLTMVIFKPIYDPTVNDGK